MLLPSKKWTCKECQKAINRFRHRIMSDATDFYPSTKNTLLTPKQTLHKLIVLRKKCKYLSRQNKIVKSALESEGVNIREDLSERLTDIPEDCQLTPLQELFLQQQFNAGSVKNAQGFPCLSSLLHQQHVEL
ncbi:hypothetical protein FOCC_FOCC014580 [Frankliniella occidentalis]|nr:hypothetical protein FOCC_FOCC014580 [Frankliniella occidentalis]